MLRKSLHLHNDGLTTVKCMRRKHVANTPRLEWYFVKTTAVQMYPGALAPVPALAAPNKVKTLVYGWTHTPTQTFWF